MSNKIKDIVKSLEEVDEKLREYYVKEGEEFVFVGVDDSETKKKVDEFRNTNKNYFKQLQEYEKKLKAYEGIDPSKWEEAQKLLEQRAKEEELKLKNEGNFDELFTKRSEAMRAEHDRALKAKEEAFRKAVDERDALKHKLGAHLIDAEVQKAVMKAGKLRDGAIEDVLSRARRVWNLDEHGNIIPRKNGETMFGRDGEVLKIDEWAGDLPAEAPHLFEASRGGGSEGSTGKVKEDRVIDNDPVAIGRNLEAIAKGTLKVRTP